MQMGIRISVMKGCPVVLIRTVCVLRPFQKVLCSLVVDDELNKFPTKDAICTATDNIDVVGWWRMCSVHVHKSSLINSLLPYL